MKKTPLPKVGFKPEPGWIIILPFIHNDKEVKTKSGIFLDSVSAKKGSGDIERGIIIAAQGINHGTGAMYLKYGAKRIIENNIEYILINEDNLIGLYEKEIKKEDFI